MDLFESADYWKRSTEALCIGFEASDGNYYLSYNQEDNSVAFRRVFKDFIWGWRLVFTGEDGLFFLQVNSAEFTLYLMYEEDTGSMQVTKSREQAHAFIFSSVKEGSWPKQVTMQMRSMLGRFLCVESISESMLRQPAGKAGGFRRPQAPYVKSRRGSAFGIQTETKREGSSTEKTIAWHIRISRLWV